MSMFGMVSEPTKEESKPKQTGFLRIVMVFVLFASIIGSGSFYLTSSTEALLLTCIGKESGLPPGLACSYLKNARSPNANTLLESKVEPRQTLLAFLLSAYDEGNETHEEMLVYLLDNGVDWDMAHNGYFPPMHLSILDGRVAMVKRFLERGAPTSTAINAPGKRSHGFNTIDFTRFLLSKNQPAPMRANLKEIDALLVAAGAQSNAPPPSAEKKPSENVDGGPSPEKETDVP